jgi:hypothetical protein
MIGQQRERLGEVASEMILFRHYGPSIMLNVALAGDVETMFSPSLGFPYPLKIPTTFLNFTVSLKKYHTVSFLARFLLGLTVSKRVHKNKKKSSPRKPLFSLTRIFKVW